MPVDNITVQYFVFHWHTHSIDKQISKTLQRFASPLKVPNFLLSNEFTTTWIYKPHEFTTTWMHKTHEFTNPINFQSLQTIRLIVLRESYSVSLGIFIL